MLSSRTVRIPVMLAILLAVLGTAVPAALADDAVCEGYTDKQKIQRLGGKNAITKRPVTSPDDLLAQLQEYGPEFIQLLNSKGLAHLAEPVLEAIRTGRGLSERDMERGEVFQWMAHRKDGKEATLSGPICFASKKTYSAFVVEVTETDEDQAKARCSLNASVGSCPDRELSADASGSSPGAQLSMSGPGGSQNLPGTSWSGASSGIGDYTFTVSASATGKKTVTTHTFIIPKICLNVGYISGESKTGDGKPNTCEDSKTVTVEKCLPDCSLEVPATAMRKESFTVGASGDYDSLSVTVTDAEGNPARIFNDAGQPISPPDITPPASIFIKRPGTYTFTGTATNSAGTATCTATTTIERPAISSRWTFRAFGLSVDTDDDEIFQSSFRDDGVNERSGFRFDGGTGFGADLEYHINDRIGIQGSVLSANLDTSFILDLDNDWERDEDDASFLSLSVGVNFHLTKPDSKVDFYIGPFAGIVDLGNSTFSNLGQTSQIEIDADSVLGILLGLDVSFGDSPWGLHLGSRFMELEGELGENENEADELEMDINPLIWEIGFRYRF